MARLTSSLINNSLFLIRGRTYASSAAATESLKTELPAAASALMKEKSRKAISIGERREDEESKRGFWMRDPTTGNWIPETHFGQVDVADLRHKLLPSKHKN